MTVFVEAKQDQLVLSYTQLHDLVFLINLLSLSM
jgi:hypothetical protein